MASNYPIFKVTFTRCSEPPPRFNNVRNNDYLVPVRCPICQLVGHGTPCDQFVPSKCTKCFRVGHYSEDCHESVWLNMRKRHQ